MKPHNNWWTDLVDSMSVKTFSIITIGIWIVIIILVLMYA